MSKAPLGQGRAGRGCTRSFEITPPLCCVPDLQMRRQWWRCIYRWEYEWVPSRSLAGGFRLTVKGRLQPVVLTGGAGIASVPSGSVPASVRQGYPGLLKILHRWVWPKDGPAWRGIPFETWISMGKPIVFCRPGLQM